MFNLLEKFIKYSLFCFCLLLAIQSKSTIEDDAEEVISALQAVRDVWHDRIDELSKGLNYFEAHADEIESFDDFTAQAARVTDISGMIVNSLPADNRAALQSNISRVINNMTAYNTLIKRVREVVESPETAKEWFENECEGFLGSMNLRKEQLLEFAERSGDRYYPPYTLLGRFLSQSFLKSEHETFESQVHRSLESQYARLLTIRFFAKHATEDVSVLDPVGFFTSFPAAREYIFAGGGLLDPTPPNVDESPSMLTPEQTISVILRRYTFAQVASAAQLSRFRTMAHRALERGLRVVEGEDGGSRIELIPASPPRATAGAEAPVLRGADIDELVAKIEGKAPHGSKKKGGKKKGGKKKKGKGSKAVALAVAAPSPSRTIAVEATAAPVEAAEAVGEPKTYDGAGAHPGAGKVEKLTKSQRKRRAKKEKALTQPLETSHKTMVLEAKKSAKESAREEDASTHLALDEESPGEGKAEDVLETRATKAHERHMAALLEVERQHEREKALQKELEAQRRALAAKRRAARAERGEEERKTAWTEIAEAGTATDSTFHRGAGVAAPSRSHSALESAPSTAGASATSKIPLSDASFSSSTRRKILDFFDSRTTAIRNQDLLTLLRQIGCEIHYSTSNGSHIRVSHPHLRTKRTVVLGHPDPKIGRFRIRTIRNDIITQILDVEA